MPEAPKTPVVRAAFEILSRVNAISRIDGVGIRLHIFTQAADGEGFTDVVVDFNTTERHDGFWREDFMVAIFSLKVLLALFETASGQGFTQIDSGRQPMEMYYRADLRVLWEEMLARRRQEASPGPTLP